MLNGEVYDLKSIETELRELSEKESEFEINAFKWLKEPISPHTATDNVNNDEPAEPVYQQKPSNMRGC